MSAGLPPAEAGIESLLRRVAMQRQQPAKSGAPDPASQSADDDPTDFGTLPGYDELIAHRMLSTQFGFQPYFRTHDARADGKTKINGRSFANFSSYDYLGLNGHPDIAAAVQDATAKYGVSAGASRHVGGARPVHHDLERALADLYGVEDAVTFVSGYSANCGVIGQLVGPKDLVVMDAVIHNSAVTGAVLSGANRRSFPHNDLDVLENILKTSRHRFKRVLIVVEGLYSMHGDVPDLSRLIDIKKKYNAWLMVDEAHALGVVGQRGFGSWEHCRVDPRDVDIWMGTLSKTLVGCGGFIAGSEKLVYYLRCTVGAFVYSVAMPPLIAAASLTALDIMRREPERVAKLQSNVARFHELARKHKLQTGTDAESAIVPILVGQSLAAVQLSEQLYRNGINVQPVIYPAVPAREARLRFFLTATHQDDDFDSILEAVAKSKHDIDTSTPFALAP